MRIARSTLHAVAAQGVGRRDPASRSAVDDAHLEAVAIESEVPLDPVDEAGNGRVAANGPPATPLSVSAREACVETFLVGAAQHAFDAAPVGTLEALERFGLGHLVLLCRGGTSAGHSIRA